MALCQLRCFAAVAADQRIASRPYDVGFAQSDEVGDGIVEAVWSDALIVVFL